MRLNTLSCGLLFVGIGLVLLRARKKEHFEPVAAYLGWLLVLISLISGALSDSDSFWAYTIISVLVGSVIALLSFLHRRFPLFAMGVSSAYVGLSRAAVSAVDSEGVVFLWFLATSVLFITGLIWTHRTMVRTS
jgi:hypothetical protein